MGRVLKSPAVPWTLSVLLAALYLLKPAPATAPGGPGAAEMRAPDAQAAAPAAAPGPATASAAAETPLAMLDACRQELDRVRRQAGEAAQAQGAPSPDTGPDGRPSAPGAGSGAAPPPGTPGDPDSAPASADAERGQAMLSKLLDVPPAEARWLREYVCAVDDLRADTRAQLEAALERDAPKQELEPLMERAREQRRAVLTDLKQRLGEERYDQLRAVGGLGLLSAVLDCNDG